MRTQVRNILIAGIVAVVAGVAGISISIADFAPDTKTLFAGASAKLASATDLGDGAACVSKDQVIASLSAESGKDGKLYVLQSGLEQSFADAWRREAEVESVPVSAVVAHLSRDDSASEWMVDVVEMDKQGCAMTRTIIPGQLWTTLLRQAMGVAV